MDPKYDQASQEIGRGKRDMEGRRWCRVLNKKDLWECSSAGFEEGSGGQKNTRMRASESGSHKEWGPLGTNRGSTALKLGGLHTSDI